MEALGTLVSSAVLGMSLFKTLGNLFGGGQDDSFHLLDEGHLGLVEVHDVLHDLFPGGDSRLLQVEARSHPDRVPLVQVHEAVDVGEKSVVTPLDDRLEVGLDKLAGYLEDHAEGYSLALFDLIDVGTLDGDLAVLDLVHRRGDRELEAVRLGTAHLYPDVAFPDPLPLVHGGHVQFDFFCHFYNSVFLKMRK